LDVPDFSWKSDGMVSATLIVTGNQEDNRRKDDYG